MGYKTNITEPYIISQLPYTTKYTRTNNVVTNSWANSGSSSYKSWYSAGMSITHGLEVYRDSNLNHVWRRW